MPDANDHSDHDEAVSDQSLEAPRSVNDLYLYRGDEVVAERPLMTGDVLGDVLADNDTDGLAIILTHPCSMRTGVELIPRLLVAPIQRHQAVTDNQWRGHMRVMPLPELRNRESFAARFADLTQVPTDQLNRDQRIACLSETGIALLQQRLVAYLTRFTVKKHLLGATSAAVLVEVDLMEEWCSAAVASGQHSLAEAERSFHEWIRADNDGTSRQERLKDSLERAPIRRELAAELAARARTA